MNTTAQITNGMLYDLIKELKVDMNRRFDEVDKKFEEVDRRFEDIDRRFEDVDRRFDEQQTYMERRFEEMDRRFNITDDKISDLAVQVSKNTDKIEDLYFHRDKVKITFSRVFAGGIVLFSGVTAYIGALLGIKQ